MTSRYSIFTLARNALTRHRRWPAAWRDPEPRDAYDVVIIGAGGHGLATAYYLAKNHGITKVAVLEKSWLGGGNTARNTTIVRSDYLLGANADFMEFSLKLWEGLSQELNYNVMFSQRGYIDLAHSDAQLELFMQRGNAMRLRGIDAHLLSLDELRVLVPVLNCGQDVRFPIVGGLMQERAGTARHDAVAWGYARVLGKICPLDLHPGVFGNGRCVQSRFARHDVLLHAVDERPTFDLYVPRSYALSLWDCLSDAAREFGYRVEA